jgi:chromosome segregation ATPase
LNDAERQELEDWRAVAANLEQREDQIGMVLDQLEQAQADAESERRHTRYLNDRFGGLEKSLAKAKAEIKELKANPEPAPLTLSQQQRRTILDRIRRPIGKESPAPEPVDPMVELIRDIATRLKRLESRTGDLESRQTGLKEDIRSIRESHHDLNTFTCDMFKAVGDRIDFVQSEYRARPRDEAKPEPKPIEFTNFRKMQEDRS